MERLLAVLCGEQIVDMRDADLRRIAWIDRASTGSGAIEIRRGVVGVDDVLGLYAEAREVRIEQRRIRIGVEQAGNPDTELFAALHERGALLDGLGDK